MSNWTKKGLQIQSIRIPTCVWECVCIFPHSYPTEPIQPKSGQGVGMASNELIQQTAVPRQTDGRTSFADIYIHFPHGTSPLFLSLFTLIPIVLGLNWTWVKWIGATVTIDCMYCVYVCVCGLWSTSISGENCALEYHPKLMQMTVMITFVCVCSLRNSIHLNSKWKHQACSTSHYNWHFPGWGKTETCTTEIWATGISLNAINRKGPRMIIIGF